MSNWVTKHPPLILGAGLFLLTAGLSAAPAHPAAAHAAPRSVIVQAAGGTPSARAAVEILGGRVTRSLPIIGGVAARLSPRASSRLGASRVFQVTPNGRVDFDQATDFTLEPQRVQKIVGSDRLWNEGITGRGVTVALLDTGVYSDHPDLSGRVVHCEDLSHEAGTDAECQDTFGHGTFMAGLIAGNGSSSEGAFTGTAPEANLVSVKLAGFDGATDVSNVLAGIQWTVAHRATYGIKVMNLSLGTDSSQTSLLSPLNYAVERAWKAGISVVVSAGNNGPGPRTILKPADDPFVITVGASNDEGTPSVISDDGVPVFSSRGPSKADGYAKPDVVAPGTHTISLRSPGSAIDQEFGDTAVVDGDYFRGTGTSMAAATATGVVAQMLQAAPTIVPDQVKYRLTATARRIAITDKYAVGSGLIDAYAAAKNTSKTKANQGLLLGAGNGLGTIQNDRGSLVIGVTTPAGEVDLVGEKKAQYDPTLGLLARQTRTARTNLRHQAHRAGLSAAGLLADPLGLLPWLSPTYTLTGWDPVTWATTTFVTAEWAGARWKGARWKETSWDGARWKGTDWVNTDWTGARWKGSEWDGARWKATNFQSRWYAAAWD